MPGAGGRLLSVIGLCAAIVCQAGAQLAPDRAQAFERARLLLDAGAYADAERVSRELTADVEARDGAESIDFNRAAGLFVDASIRNGKGAAPETRAIAERALEIQERLRGPAHLETAAALYHVASVDIERGDFRAAVSRHTRALAIRERTLTPGDQAIADSLDGVGMALIGLQTPSDFEQAQTTLTRSVAIREAASDRAPRALARTLELVAWLNRTKDSAAAKTAVERAIEIQSRHGPDHPDTITTKEIRGDLHWIAGELAAARDTWRDAHARADRQLGAGHPLNVPLLRRLGMAARTFGDQADARVFFATGLDLAERTLAPCHPELGWQLNDNAYSAEWDGEYIEAQRLFRQAQTTAERCFGPTHATVATIVHNQSELAALMGDDAEARRLEERATEIWSAALGPNHRYVAKGLSALADLLAAHGSTARARALYVRALKIQRSAEGSDDAEVAWTLANLARLDLKSGEVSTALRSVGQAVAIYEKTGVSDEPDRYARTLMLQAEIERRLGRFRDARATLVDAIAIRDRTFGPSHPLAAESRVELAATSLALGQSADALDTALAAERDGRDHLRFTVRYLPERQAMAYAARRPHGLDLAVSIIPAAGHPSDAPLALDAVIRSRAIVLDELTARARSTAAVDAELASLNASLVAARQRFANLMLLTLRGESVPHDLLDAARQQKEDAERELAGRSAAVQAELTSARAGLAEIRSALPPRSALIPYVRYDRSIVSRAGTTTSVRVVPSYIAFVIRAGSDDVVAVPLGAAVSLEALVAAWRQQVARGASAFGVDPKVAETAYRTSAIQLRQRIWDPLAQQLAGSDHVFVVPDGALNFVSLAALPAPGGAYLGEDRRVLHYLSTERDLVLPPPASRAHGLLAVGGPAFGVRTTTRSMASSAPSRATPAPCAARPATPFDALPESMTEATGVARIWSNSAAGTATVLTGASATESAVKAAVVDRQVVHLATHGFVVDPGCARGPTNRINAVENPLLLSGLAFAGANNPPGAPNQDDGILTAEEVAGLNLQSTEWAVLSACDTGLGEIKSGEGVFGFRRAFQIAGARTVVMSLWSVDDEATQAWMIALYRARFSNGLSTADAMHDAGLSVLRARRARGESVHPFYWAGFVAVGDWR